jgi:hypothetical protein
MAGNILHTLRDEEFREFIESKLRAREQKVINTRDWGYRLKIDLLRYSRARILFHFQGVKYLLTRKSKFESANS